MTRVINNDKEIKKLEFVARSQLFRCIKKYTPSPHYSVS